MASRSPNLLFIMTDHQRADSLGMFQAGVEVTPNLNRLASQGTVFSRAYNTCPLCVPARTALATGKYPTSNGVVFNDWQGLRAGDHKPIHQYLAEAGYEVGHIGVHHVRVTPTLEERAPFARWIDNGDYARYFGQYLAENGMAQEPAGWREAFRRDVLEYQEGGFVPQRYSNTRTAVWPYPEEGFKDSYFCRQGVDFLRRRRDEPFALFVYLWAPHPPLRVPEPYASLFPPAEIELPANVGVPARGEPPDRRQGISAQLAEGISMAEWRKAWAAHLGLVRLADAGLGRILGALEGVGGTDSADRERPTVVVFTVDHGDHLGQHCMYQKMEMYEQAIRVPLIVRVSGCKHRTFDVPVSHLDVMPTLFDLIGLQKPDDLDGISLVDALTSGALPPERPVFCQYSGNPTVGDIRRTVITLRHKYTYTPGDAPELYDLENDPSEMHNLGVDPAYAQLVQELHRQCEAWAERHGDWIEF